MARSQRRRSGRTPVSRLVVSLVLLTYLGFFVFLSGDALIRIIMIRGTFETTADAAAVILLEGSRTLALGLALLLAESIIRASGRSRIPGLFTVFVAFLGIWYAKTAAFSAFPGHVQEWMAGHLLSAGIPLAVLDFLFGAPEWCLWIAAGAALRLSVAYPRAVTSASIGVSGDHDRRGLMRSVALAGFDIGAGFRRMAAFAVSRGILRPAVVWPTVILAGIAHSLFSVLTARVLLAAALVGVVALTITNARASLASANERQRNRIMWVVVAAVTAGAAFVVSAILSLGSDAMSPVLGVMVASVAPFGVLIALARAALLRTGAARPWLHFALLAGSSAITGSIAYHFALAALPVSPGPELPVRETIALVTSVVLVIVVGPRLRLVAGRFSGAAGAQRALRT